MDASNLLLLNSIDINGIEYLLKVPKVVFISIHELFDGDNEIAFLA